MKKTETREKKCTTCGETFTAVRKSHGGWSSTCSLPCRLEALDRFIAVMQRNRDRLAAELEDGRW